MSEEKNPFIYTLEDKKYAAKEGYLSYEIVKDWTHSYPTRHHDIFHKVYICESCLLIEDDYNHSNCSRCGSTKRVDAIAKYLPPKYEKQKIDNIFDFICAFLFHKKIEEEAYWLIVINVNKDFFQRLKQNDD